MSVSASLDMTTEKTWGQEVAESHQFWQGKPTDVAGEEWREFCLYRFEGALKDNTQTQKQWVFKLDGQIGQQSCSYVGRLVNGYVGRRTDWLVGSWAVKCVVLYVITQIDYVGR